MSGSGHACRGAHVEARGELHGFSSLSPPLGGFWAQTRVTRLGQQMPLPTKLSCLPSLPIRTYSSPAFTIHISV